MAIKCADCPLRRHDLFQPFSDEDVRAIQRFKVGEMTVEAATPLLMEGSSSPQLFTVLRGMGLRYKMLEDGRRHVLSFVFPGDFLGLQASAMGEMGHSIEATSDMTLCVFNRSELWRFFRNHPERAYDITWLAAVEEHFLGEALVTVGQRSAFEAVAWALLRIFKRGLSIGTVAGNVMDLPYKQQDLADALGLSLVHTNKTLGKLRDRQLANWSNGKLTVYDMDRLAEEAAATTDDLPVRPLM